MKGAQSMIDHVKEYAREFDLETEKIDKSMRRILYDYGIKILFYMEDSRSIGGHEKVENSGGF